MKLLNLTTKLKIRRTWNRIHRSFSTSTIKTQVYLIVQMISLEERLSSQKIVL